jgi:hypothetical protein
MKIKLMMAGLRLIDKKISANHDNQDNQRSIKKYLVPFTIPKEAFF